LLLSLFGYSCLMTIKIFDEVWTIIIVVLINRAWVSLWVILIFLRLYGNLRRSMLYITSRLYWLAYLTVHVYFIFIYVLRIGLTLKLVLICTECLVIVVNLKILEEKHLILIRWVIHFIISIFFGALCLLILIFFNIIIIFNIRTWIFILIIMLLNNKCIFNFIIIYYLIELRMLLFFSLLLKIQIILIV
jgi:hypothetical protein